MITEQDIRDTLLDMQHAFPGMHLRKKPWRGRCGPTIGPVFFISRDWETYPPLRRYTILHHEAVHMGQYQLLGCGSLWLGVVPFLMAYLLLPLPMVGAWCRYALERSAFAVEMRVIAREEGMQALYNKRNHYVRQFTGRAYWWAWPLGGMAQRWVDATILAIAMEHEHGL